MNDLVGRQVAVTYSAVGTDYTINSQVIQLDEETVPDDGTLFGDTAERPDASIQRSRITLESVVQSGTTPPLSGVSAVFTLKLDGSSGSRVYTITNGLCTRMSITAVMRDGSPKQRVIYQIVGQALTSNTKPVVLTS